jgi:hypothetical protein
MPAWVVFLQGCLFIVFDNDASGSFTCIVVWKNIKLYNIFIVIFTINKKPCKNTTQAGTNHKILLNSFFLYKNPNIYYFFFTKNTFSLSFYFPTYTMLKYGVSSWTKLRGTYTLTLYYLKWSTNLQKIIICVFRGHAQIVWHGGTQFTLV